MARPKLEPSGTELVRYKYEVMFVPDRGCFCISRCGGYELEKVSEDENGGRYISRHMAAQFCEKEAAREFAKEHELPLEWEDYPEE